MQSLDVEFQHLDTTPIACSHLGLGTMLQISPNHWKHMKTYHTIVCRETLTNNMSSRPNKFFPIILRNSGSSLLETLYQTVRCWFSVDTEYFWRSSSSSGVGLRYVPGQWSYWSFTMDCVGPQLKNSGGGGGSGGGAGAGAELESKETILSCRARLRQQKWIWFFPCVFAMILAWFHAVCSKSLFQLFN